MADSLYRQWRVLMAIPRYPKGIKIQQIMEQLHQDNLELPTYRTIQRDLDTLTKVFPLLKYELRDGANYWFMETEDGVTEIPHMGTPTALAFHLAEQHLRSLLPPSALSHLKGHFKTATQLLDQHPNALADWREKIRVLPQTQALIPPDIDPSVLEVVYTALLQEQQFEAKYFGRRDDQYKVFLVNPLALVFRGPITYLICTLNEYTDIRLLGLHRLVEANLKSNFRRVPQGFNLDTYIAEGHVDFLKGVTIHLEMLIEEEVAIHLHECQLNDQQQMLVQENGQTLFEATVQDTGQLRWWLLGFADQIEVLKPESLREEFKAMSARMVETYQDKKP